MTSDDYKFMITLVVSTIGAQTGVIGLLFLAINWRIGDSKESIKQQFNDNNKRIDDLKDSLKIQFDYIGKRLEKIEEKLEVKVVK